MKDIDIRRGDIYWIKGIGGQYGSEIHDDRPGIVVSSDFGNRTSNNVIVVYMTTQEKRSMVVHAEVMGTKPATALCEQVYTVSKDRLERYIRTCTEAEMQQIDQALRFSMGMVDTIQPADTNERIKELEALLEAEKATCGVYKRRIEEAEATIGRISGELAAAKRGDERIELKAKLSVYMGMYDKLLERVLGM